MTKKEDAPCNEKRKRNFAMTKKHPRNDKRKILLAMTGGIVIITTKNKILLVITRK